MDNTLHRSLNTGVVGQNGKQFLLY